jgi:hypothetical protein
MAASTIFFNGRLIGTPGSYSEVDARGLEAIGLGASGIVALIGTAQGGKPVTAMSSPDDFIRITRPGQERDHFRSGDLYEGVPIAFAPANDEEIQAGAQEVICMKTNPSTQSTVTLPNSEGNAVDLTSRDYGAHTEQVNISVASGTVQGKLVTIVFEDITEPVDDLGGDDLFTLQYADGGTEGWDTMTAEVLAGGGTSCDGTRDTGGLDGDIGTTLAAPGAIEVVSSAADTNWCTVYGLENTSGNPISERLQLNGTTAVPGTKTFGAGDVLGVKIDGTHAGTVSVRPSGGGSDVFTVTTGTDTEAGLVRGIGMFVSGSAVTIVGDGATTKDLIIVGTGSTGAELLEKLTLNGTTPVVGTGNFTKITALVLGDVEAAVTVTTSAEAAATTAAVQDTLQKMADYYNARVEGSAGFTFTLITGQTSFDPDNLDISVSAVNCFSPAEPGFKADLYTFIDWLNQNSQFISAARSSGATGGAPSNTTAPVFLSGGIDGVATQSEYQTALDLLKQVRANTLVPLTSDPAVHSAAGSHCVYMGGIGRNERDCVVGLKNTAQTGLATKTEIKSQIQALNSRHVRAVAQDITRYNVAGERTIFDPAFRAIVVAGMQAGSDVGTPLTYKYEDSLAFAQDSSWNPTDDSEEMIQAGLMFAESVEGLGRRWVRNITTHLSSSNLAYTEGSVNEATNYATYNFRTAMEIAVGKKGFSGTINGAKGVAIGILDSLVDEEVLTQWRSLNIDSVLDALEVGAEIAPVLPINFVKNTMHLVTIRQTA